MAVKSALAAAMPAATMSAGGIGVTGWMGAGGALLTAATTGYLALKKREQMRPEPKRRDA